jgi:hypothetical protein
LRSESSASKAYRYKRFADLSPDEDGSPETNEKEEIKMSNEENKAIARQAVEAINAGDFSTLESLVAADGADYAVPPASRQSSSLARSALQSLTCITPSRM